MKKRIIAIFTGNRAEYGLQYPILRAVNQHPKLDYRLIVSGAHLDINFGRTLEEIHQDGFRIDEEVKIVMDADKIAGKHLNDSIHSSAYKFFYTPNVKWLVKID